MKPPVIYVAVLTYRRPEPLTRLLDALVALDLPSVDVRFLIVDNDVHASAREIVESFRPKFTATVLEYVVEPIPGIPAGRNRALTVAKTASAQLIAFTDDDAYPKTDWLQALLQCHLASGAVLTFGPQRLEAADDLRGFGRRLLARSLVGRARYMERSAARHARKGEILFGATNNCMCDLEWITCRGIAFDASRSVGGGSDTAFREAVRTAGGRLAWCEQAVVVEGLPAERVTLRYQFRRACAHGMTAEQVTRHSHKRPLHNPALRIAAGAGLMALPVFGLASFTLGLHLLGMGIGMLRARRGDHSDLYDRSNLR